MLDKEQLRPGLVIFRRADVEHRQWYCRLKVPKTDRYKVVSLKTTDVHEARDKAFDQEIELRFKEKHDIPIFDKRFSEVAQQYSDFQKQRAEAGEITLKRWQTEDGFLRTQLNRYVGNEPITSIGENHWTGYPLWRRSNGKGRKTDRVSDWTIRSEMKTFRNVMFFGKRKKHVTAEQLEMFDKRVKLDKPRGEAFTPEEYRQLHIFARTTWMKAGENAESRWQREIFYNFMLVMTNTGMRPAEGKNLRWRDIGESIQRANEQPFVPIDVRGKGKFRKLVGPLSVATYFGRIKNLVAERFKKLGREIKPDDFVFINYDGTPARHLYRHLLRDLLGKTSLLRSAAGTIRSAYSFRHTYATFRLMRGKVEIHDLALQMGTSSTMIEEHYSHVTPVKNADRILQGIPGWEEVAAASGEEASRVNADAAGAKAKPGKAPPKAGKASRSTRRR